MKAFLTFLLMTTLSTPTFADVKISTDCSGNYGPLADNLAVSTDHEFVDVGYITMGVFFAVKTTGCKKIEIVKQELHCDGARVGSLGDFQSTSDNGGEPRAYVKFDPNVNVTASGSCGKGRLPLQLSIVK